MSGGSMNRRLVRPRTGLVVRDPVTHRALPEGGSIVPMSSYWIRRLECGDVAVMTADVPDGD